MLMLSCSRLSICLTTTSSLIQLLPSTYCWPWPFYLSPPISFLLTLPPSLSSINDVVWFWDSSHSTFKNLNNRFIYIQHYSSTQVSCWMLLGKHTHTHIDAIAHLCFPISTEPSKLSINLSASFSSTLLLLFQTVSTLHTVPTLPFHQFSLRKCIHYLVCKESWSLKIKIFSIFCHQPMNSLLSASIPLSFTTALITEVSFNLS